MSVRPNDRRGGFGWQEPLRAPTDAELREAMSRYRYKASGRQQGKTEGTAEVIVRALKGGKLDAAAISLMLQSGAMPQNVFDRVAEMVVGTDAGYSFHYGAHKREQGEARAPVPEDTIDMIEIDGVWMSHADAHTARLQIGRPG